MQEGARLGFVRSCFLDRGPCKYGSPLLSPKYRYVVSLCHAGRVRGQGQFKPPAVGAERRLRKDWGLGACAGIPGSAVSVSTKAGRQQIAQDECGKDAFPDPASEAPVQPVGDGQWRPDYLGLKKACMGAHWSATEGVGWKSARRPCGMLGRCQTRQRGFLPSQSTFTAWSGDR